MKLTLKNVRLAFPNLFTPKAFETDGNPRYSAVFLLSPDDLQVDEIREAMKEAANSKWTNKGPQTYAALEKADKLCLHDGAVKSDYDGFDGMLYVSAARPGDGPPPTIVDRDPLVRLTPSDGKPYAGCYVNAVLDIYEQDNAYGKRINATLTGVQFRRDGDAFGGGRPAVPDDFENLSAEDDDDDMV